MTRPAKPRERPASRNGASSRRTPIDKANERMAVPQITQEQLQRAIAQDKNRHGGGVYNFWFRTDASNKLGSFSAKNPFFCDINKASGRTRGSSIPGAPICLHFARGTCYEGENCRKLHRLPRKEDRINPSKDCFGREKYATLREDGIGVGSFNHANTDLLVEQIEGQVSERDFAQVVRRAFSKFGENPHIKSLDYPNRKVLLHYKDESKAQFTKEAMQSQVFLPGAKRGVIVRWVVPERPKVPPTSKFQVGSSASRSPPNHAYRAEPRKYHTMGSLESQSSDRPSLEPAPIGDSVSATHEDAATGSSAPVHSTPSAIHKSDSPNGLSPEQPLGSNALHEITDTHGPLGDVGSPRKRHVEDDDSSDQLAKRQNLGDSADPSSATNYIPPPSRNTAEEVKKRIMNEISLRNRQYCRPDLDSSKRSSSVQSEEIASSESAPDEEDEEGSGSLEDFFKLVGMSV